MPAWEAGNGSGPAMATINLLLPIVVTALGQAGQVLLYIPPATGSQLPTYPFQLYASTASGSGASRACPVDRPFVGCSVAPCSSTGSSGLCPNYPTAVCIDDMCGGCTARFYIPRGQWPQLAGQASAAQLYWASPNAFTEVTVQCFGPLPVLSYGAWPSADPSVTPVSAFSISRSYWSAVDVCPPGVPITEKTCMPNRQTPCQVFRCPQYPAAECVNFHCGDCRAQFYQNGVDVSQSCGITNPQTPTWRNAGSPLSGTLADQLPVPYNSNPLPAPGNTVGLANPASDTGCRVSTGRALLPAPANLCNYDTVCRGLDVPSVCPQFPAAVCSSDPCGSSSVNPTAGVCRVKFLLGSTDVTSVCFPPRSQPDAGSLSIPAAVVARLCPDGRAFRIVCNFPPCGRYGSGCPGYPAARCLEDSCGACTARYFVSATEVTSLCYPYPTKK